MERKKVAERGGRGVGWGGGGGGGGGGGVQNCGVATLSNNRVL